MATIHPQRWIEFGSQAANVDEGVADLILEIWKAGIDTEMSCENNTPKGFVWILFPTATDAECFLDIVANPYEKGYETLYQRIAPEFYPNDPKKERALTRIRWRYGIVLDDTAIEGEARGGCWHSRRPDKAAMLFGVSVRFPIQDLSVILERLQSHNEEKIASLLQ